MPMACKTFRTALQEGAVRTHLSFLSGAAHLHLLASSVVQTSQTATETAGSLTCNDSFHSMLKVGSIDGFVTLPSSMKSSFVTYICYVSSCRREFMRIIFL